MAASAVAAIKPVAERVSVLETKVEHMDEKLDDIKSDVKEMHDCLDRTRELLDGKLEAMLIEYRSNRDKFYEHADKLHASESAEHKVLAEKISELEKFKNKWMYMMMGGIAVIGWITGHIDKIADFLK